MNRRNFCIKIVKMGALLVLLPSSKLVSNELFNGSMMEVFNPQKGFLPLKLAWKNNIAYARIKELANVLETNFYENIQKGKIVLYYHGSRFTITSDNNFLRINGNLYQMPYEAREIDGEIFVPVEDFIIYFNQHCGTDLAVKSKIKQEVKTVETQNQETSAIKSLVNVNKVKIENKNNGILINIDLDSGLTGSEVGVEFRNEWLFIDLYKGKINEKIISSYQPQKPVKDVKTYQHKELASIALLLDVKKWKREVWVEPDEKKVKVILIDEEYQIKEKDVAESKNEAHDKLEQEKRKWYIDTIILDPGHGGKDPGAIGYKKLQEKKIVLPIARNLEKIIKKKLPGVKVLMTRNKDVFIPLKNRTKFANRNSGKLFISIHANSLKSRKVNGFETFFLGPDRGDLATEIVMKENSVIEFETKDAQKEYEGIKFIMATMAQNAYMRQSEYLARMVQEEMGQQMKSLHMKNRGVKQGNFWVLVGATMPNILVETGFISNKHDSKILNTKKYQMKIAEGIFKGIKRFKEDTESAI